MKQKHTMLITAAAMVFFIAPAYALPTLGSCVGAIKTAQAHSDKWQEKSFTLEECGVVASNVTNAESVLKNPGSSKKSRDHAAGVFRKEARSQGLERSTVRERHITRRYYYHNNHEPDWCCLATPGYMSRNGFFHQYHLYDR